MEYCLFVQYAFLFSLEPLKTINQLSKILTVIVFFVQLDYYFLEDFRLIKESILEVDRPTWKSFHAFCEHLGYNWRIRVWYFIASIAIIFYIFLYPLYFVLEEAEKCSIPIVSLLIAGGKPILMMLIHI